jgi:general secretion pathway protein D
LRQYRRERRDISLEEPRISKGVLLETPADWSARWQEMVAEKEAQTEAASAAPSITSDRPGEDAAEPAAPVETLTPPPSWPPGAGRIIDLPRLNRQELAEFLNALVRRLQAGQGYTVATPAVARDLPELPDGFDDERVLVRETETGLRALRIGYWRYQSQLPQLAFYGVVIQDEGLRRSGDLAAVESAIETVRFSREEMRGNLTADRLDRRVIQLNYIDVPSAMNAMKGLGLTIFPTGTDLPEEVVFDSLPFVVELPGPQAESAGLVGGGSVVVGEMGSSTIPSLASALAQNTVASPASRLLILYHPAHPEQFSRVTRLLHDIIDRPARQIFVEGLVLEIDEAGLQELGIEWELEDSKVDLTLGTLMPDFRFPPDTANLDSEKNLDLRSDWKVRVRALIADGKAEILSRPSILTLNERQATIRVGTDIPIATSQEGLSESASKIAFDFKYIPVGILLNIRPRATEDGSEVSLMVDTIVSARTPEGDLEIRDENGTLLASAPTIQSRRVQTYARIQNNTPFIIGGLVSRSKTVITDKVPILGDIPLLGALFRSTSERSIRQEVIIVLTPYVLPEDLHLSRALPKAGVDTPPSKLFRAAYRLGREDIVDISFIYTNQRFQTYQELAREAIREDFRLAETEPFGSFGEGRLPGAQVLVDRIIYNAIRRLKLADSIDTQKILVMTGLQPSGYEVAFLDAILAQQGEGENYEDFFTKYPDKAVALSFLDPYETAGGAELASDPVPAIQLLDCPDRAVWSRLLSELNQPDESGRSLYTILLHHAVDVHRLQSALLLKQILAINGGRSGANFRNFIPGRMIEVPEISPEAILLLDAEIARYFYHSQHFYSETIAQTEAALLQLDRELRKPEWRHLLKGIGLPPLEE